CFPQEVCCIYELRSAIASNPHPDAGLEFIKPVGCVRAAQCPFCPSWTVVVRDQISSCVVLNTYVKLFVTPRTTSQHCLWYFRRELQPIYEGLFYVPTSAVCQEQGVLHFCAVCATFASCQRCQHSQRHSGWLPAVTATRSETCPGPPPEAGPPGSEALWWSFRPGVWSQKEKEKKKKKRKPPPQAGGAAPPPPGPCSTERFRNPKASLHTRLSYLIKHLQKKGDRHCQEFYRALQINAEQLYNDLPSRKILSPVFFLTCFSVAAGFALFWYCSHSDTKVIGRARRILGFSPIIIGRHVRNICMLYLEDISRN
uniref:Uncharacterized protein n=1 Tax=Anas platyrhynchos platyrhynchos TaxID=8840 RepID=A0A493U2A6_ANAPP